MATGGTLGAAETLIELLPNCHVVASACVFEIEALGGRKKLKKPHCSLIVLRDKTPAVEAEQAI